MEYKCYCGQVPVHVYLTNIKICWFRLIMLLPELKAGADYSLKMILLSVRVCAINRRYFDTSKLFNSHQRSREIALDVLQRARS